MGSQANAAPRIYGNYRTVHHLGSGGMGAVFLGERADGQFQHTVAIKVIAPYVAREDAIATAGSPEGKNN